MPAATIPAITARPVAVRNGLKLSSAHTVQGSEKEKPRTPTKATRSPEVGFDSGRIATRRPYGRR